MKIIKVNINIQAKVELTDYGKQILKEYYDKLGINHYLDNKEFIFPLWQIASIFGRDIGHDKLLFKNNEIELIETGDDLIEIIKQ